MLCNECFRRCHVVVGTPGRIRQMVDEGHLKTDSVRMFCLDEADKMMERAFKNDVTFVFNKLPPAKQVMALSATYTSELASILTGGVTNSIFFRLLRAGGFLGRFFVNSGAKKLKKILLNSALWRQGQTIVLFFLVL